MFKSGAENNNRRKRFAGMSAVASTVKPVSLPASVAATAAAPGGSRVVLTAGGGDY